MNNKNTQQQTMMQPLMIDFKKVIRTRQLNFDKEFTREYVADVCSALDKLMEFDKIMETPKEALKIKFNIYSYGGQCDSLMYLLSKIDKLKETLKLVNPTPNIKPFEPFNIPVRTQNIGNNIDSVQMEINLPNVTNYEEFKSNLIKDRQFEKVIQTMTFGNALGGNTLNKYRIR